MSLVSQIPKTAIILPPRTKVLGTNPLILQKITRTVRKFKTTKAQRERARAIARKFKLPILTFIAVAPAVFLAINDAMANATTLQRQIFFFARSMLRSYTGITIFESGQFSFKLSDAAVGWVPIMGILAVKVAAKKIIMKLNRSATQAQLPVSIS